MKLVDHDGRLFGVLNLIDAFAGILVLLLVVPTFLYGAELIVARATEIAVTGVTPRTVVVGELDEITITGRNLGGINRVEFGSHTSPRFRHTDQRTLAVTVPSDLPPGIYPIVLLNRWGKAAKLTEPVLVGHRVEPVLIENREQVVPASRLTSNVALTLADPLQVLPKPVTYEDVPIIVLCTVEPMPFLINGLPNPERGFDVEHARVRPIPVFGDRSQQLMSVQFKARMVVQGDDRSFFAPGGEPLTLGKKLYLTRRRLQAIVRSSPLVLEEPRGPGSDVEP